jgi:hypothetical protein
MSNVAGKSISITIDNVLLAINSDSIISSVIANYMESGSTLVFNFSNIKYNFGTDDNSSTYGSAYKGGSAVTPGGTANPATWVASEALMGDDVFEGWTAVEGNYPTPIKPTFFLGYQDSYDYDVTENGGATYKLRLLATMTGEYAAAGFKNISITYKDANGETVETLTLEQYYCKYVYESVMGGGETYAADDYFSDNIFCLTIDGIDANVASIVVNVTPFVATDAENITDGAVVEFTADVHN